MDLIELIGRITTLSSITVNLVGLQICFRFIQKGSTGDMSSAPFIANFVNCCIWLRYGILTSISPVIIVNTIAACLNFTYISVFFVYTLKKLQFMRGVFLALVVLLCPLYYIRFYQSDSTIAAAHLGTMGIISTVISYAAPLASLRDVLRTKSTECMSFAMVIANFTIAAEWLFYGFLLKDKYIEMPNGIGMVLGAFQLGLFLRYPSKPQSPILKT